MDEPAYEDIVKPVEEFIDSKLRANLSSIVKTEHQLVQSIQDYEWLKAELQGRLETGEGLPESMMVDLGSNFYSKATIINRRLISVAVGFGFHVQMTIEEALTFCDKKLGLLHARIATLRGKSETIQSHIRDLLMGVEQLRLSNPC